MENKPKQIGQKFRSRDNNTYILAQTAPNTGSLIDMNAGNRFREAVKVEQIFSILPYEWEEIVGPAVGPEYFQPV